VGIVLSFTKENILEEIKNLSTHEEWNHRYEFPYGIKTCENLSVSIGNNVHKWSRLSKVINDINITNKNLIDVGCSDGFFSTECAKLGAKYVLGVDADDLRIKRAKFASNIYGLKNVEFKNIDIYGEQFNTANFDVVLALGILHRVPDVYGFLKRISKLGETIVIEFKTFDSSDSVCRWGGAERKGNEFNQLYFLPSVSFVSEILDYLSFDVTEILKDKSNLKYKRTILVAKKRTVIKQPKNLVFEKYKDIHKGKRVFLVGNGPSLADTNLNLLKDEFTIAMNRVSMIYNKNELWRPTYFLFSSTNVKDTIWGGQWLSSVKESVSEPNTTSFIASAFKKYIDPDDSYPKIKWFDSLSETKPSQKGQIRKDSFSTNIVDRIDKSGTTMNLALQLAYHMGFNEIIFVGSDLGWTKDMGSKSDPNHFDASYRANIPNPYKANHQMRNVHKLAHSIFIRDKPEVKIYNASLRSMLDVYPMIDYPSYVKNSIIKFRPDELNLASKYWDNLIDESPKPILFLVRIKNKLKRILKQIIGKSK